MASGQRFNDLTGLEFGRLLAIKKVGNTRVGNALWYCKCLCGNEAFCASSHLRNGHDISCGCAKREHSRRISLVNAIKNRGRKQSLEERLMRSAALKGKNAGSKNGRYRGTVTSRLCNFVRHSMRGREWTRLVKERDNFVCVQCGSDERLESDHIVSLREIVESFCLKTESECLYAGVLYCLDNGRTLCRPCHKRTLTYGNRFT